jgi:hypothetical protein
MPRGRPHLIVRKGLIVSVGHGGNDSDIELVRDLVKSYISRPSCLILLTVTCESKSRKVSSTTLPAINPSHSRLRESGSSSHGQTVRSRRTANYRFVRSRLVRLVQTETLTGVLTKPDRIPVGEEEHWMRFIRDEAEHLANGWFSVKQPASTDLQQGITWEQAREQESRFFSVTPPWSTERDYRHHFGTRHLTESLSNILSDLIRRRLVPPECVVLLPLTCTFLVVVCQSLKSSYRICLRRRKLSLEGSLRHLRTMHRVRSYC